MAVAVAEEVRIAQRAAARCWRANWRRAESGGAEGRGRWGGGAAGSWWQKRAWVHKHRRGTARLGIDLFAARTDGILLWEPSRLGRSDSA